MDINDILLQLGIGSKETVYMSITPGVGLELIQLDIPTRSVKNYAFRPLEYNESLREIADYDAFKDAVVELFEELKLSTKSNIILNVPMVLFGSKELPLLLGDDAVTEALTSEVEQSYIFKRYEPVVSWADASLNQNGDTRKLFYSAIQKMAIDNIKNVLTELGASLVSVEMSLTSILKALAFSGRADEQMKDNMTWNLMLVNQNGYSICSMLGKNIVDYYEEPLAIKSFEGEEIYNAINASAQITLMSYSANYLYIVSQTDLVSAEILANRLQVEGIVQYWENNEFKKQDLIPVSLEVLEDVAHKISLEAVGIATGNTTNMPVKFNFAATGTGDGAGVADENEIVPIKIGEKEFEVTPIVARNIAFIAAVAVLVPVLIVFLTLPILKNKKQAQLDDINSRLTTVQNEVKKMQEEQNKLNDFDVNSEIKKVMSNNRIKLMSYTALGESVPKHVWITYYVTKEDGKIDIKGESSNVEEVYTFFRNMKDSLIDTKLRLHKLQMQTDSVDDVVSIDPNKPVNYEFEITNMTEAELNPTPAADANQQGAAQQQPQQEEEKKGGLLNNKPLLNFGKK
ncbi:MAG: PilN domain-containing protein [Candidatus Gastranaerophilaceae bacterium]